MTRNLAELSGPAAASMLAPSSVVVVPTGAVEHHGPHLPLITDYLLADSVGSSAVERAAAAGIDVWMLPTLAYTKSDEHAWAPGTVWLSWDAMMKTVIDIGRSVATTPARTLVFLNGHGGNVALLQVALREIRRRFGLNTFLIGVQVSADGVEPPEEECDLGIHGGHGETSLIMHIRPDLVDMSLAERNVPSHIADAEYIGFHSKPVSFGWLSDDFGPSGVIGDPTRANTADGAAIFEAAVSQATAALVEISRFRPAREGL
ncbi:creatinine amidohydrolase [Arthrobacter sp. Soil736]|uniref:creatininase family protein n=1 Tax=Arthrobacter sp. Soil736 TaxID=1736395 RepID=UPI0006F39092|nr:creatininase family protein [Arthrobacter sp. Soil736]KRE67749.1 creatinine amidohydrolase [Arthrobacter sp. Soil736]